MVNYGVASTIFLALTAAAAAAAPAVTANPPLLHTCQLIGRRTPQRSIIIIMIVMEIIISDIHLVIHQVSCHQIIIVVLHHLGHQHQLLFTSRRRECSILTTTRKCIPGFEFVGDGICVDEAGEKYDYVRVSFLESAKECANLCTECPGKGQADGRKLLGFTIEECGGCFCYIENGGSFSGEVCGTGSIGLDGREGTGEIVGILSGGGSCYKVNSKSSKAPKRARKLDMRRRLMC
jgi:hypothetical protein